MDVSFVRHLSAFDATAFGDRRVDIIGVGATGSHIAYLLAKQGVRNIHIWDDDMVDPVNPPNQIYGRGHIGMPKVQALAEIIERDVGTKITPHQQAVTGNEQFGEVVFLLVDSMDTRRAIWEKGIRYKAHIKLMIETRMGVDSGYIYAFRPLDTDLAAKWEQTLFPSSEAVQSACGSSISVGPTAWGITSAVLWLLFKWFKKQQGEEVNVPFHVIISFENMQMFDPEQMRKQKKLRSE